MESLKPQNLKQDQKSIVPSFRVEPGGFVSRCLAFGLLLLESVPETDELDLQHVPRVFRHQNSFRKNTIYIV